ncbi:DMT family transporter [Desulfovibrio sp. OttesenSCG-928-G15]|nr:DMT family transporter [Desulfovibrio sp. OttesenSCG-928-G15]
MTAETSASTPGSDSMQKKIPLPPTTWGFVLAFLATVVWSFNFIASRGFAQDMPPFTLAFYRWAIALCAILPFTFRPIMQSLPHYRANWRYYLVAGLLGIAYFNTAIYYAAHTVPALNLSLIATASPLFTIILARLFLGEAIAPLRLVGMAAAFTGIILLITGGDPAILATLSFHSGDLISLSSALTFAIYTLLLRKKPSGGSASAYFAVTVGIGVAALFPCMVWEQAVGPGIHFSFSLLGGLLYMGLGASLFAFTCWTVAVGLIGPSRASIIYYSLPLFCAVEAVIFLGEAIHWYHFVSGALILGGLILATRNGAAKKTGELEAADEASAPEGENTVSGANPPDQVKAADA